jgi:hypothetical protein
MQLLHIPYINSTNWPWPKSELAQWSTDPFSSNGGSPLSYSVWAHIRATDSTFKRGSIPCFMMCKMILVMHTEQDALGITNHLLFFHYALKIWYFTEGIENTASKSYSILACVFAALSHCLATTVSYGSTIPVFRRRGGVTDTQTHRQQGNIINLLLLFQNKGSRLNIMA